MSSSESRCDTWNTSTATLSTINGGSIGSLLHLDVESGKTVTANEDGNMLLTESPYDACRVTLRGF